MNDDPSPPPSPLESRAALEARAPLLPPAAARALGSVLGPLIGLVVVIAIFGALRPQKFLTLRTLDNVVLYNFYYAVAAVGMTFVIVTAGIDLSVGSTMALSCMCCAIAIRGGTFPPANAGTTIATGAFVGVIVAICVASKLLERGRPPGRAVSTGAAAGALAGIVAGGIWLALADHVYPPMPATVAAIFGVLVGAAVGFVNGTLVSRLSLPPFVVTLATLGAVRGLTLYVCHDYPVSRDADRWDPRALAAMDRLARLQTGDFLHLPPNYWITLAVIVIAIPLLHFTILGRYAYAIGSNERTARLCGINVERYKTLCYVIAGVCAGIAGVMMTAKSNGGQPEAFSGAELTVIAAVVIGGTSLFGGEGTVVGTVLGVLMLGLLYSGCVLADISSDVQPIIVGATIVLAAALDRFRHLRR